MPAVQIPVCSIYSPYWPFIIRSSRFPWQKTGSSERKVEVSSGTEQRESPLPGYVSPDEQPTRQAAAVGTTHERKSNKTAGKCASLQLALQTAGCSSCCNL